MFTQTRRDELLETLVERARADLTVIGAALVGSAARQETDPWSDIDLALELAGGADVADAATRWTRILREQDVVTDTLDVWAGRTLYRVFLLEDSLQVDLSFWPSGTLVATGGEALTQLFGERATTTPARPFDQPTAISWGWLYALHARSAMARDRTWQSIAMINSLRDQAIMLCCARHRLPTHHSRGVDQLPQGVLAALADTVPDGLGYDALLAAFSATVGFFIEEITHVDDDLARRLRSPLETMIISARSVAAASPSRAPTAPRAPSAGTTPGT